MNRSSVSRINVYGGYGRYGRNGFRRRASRFRGKPRFVTHPMFKDVKLKPQFDTNTRVVSADYFTELKSTTEGTNAILLVTGDGFFTSANRGNTQTPILTPYPSARFDAAAAGFKEYTIVGVKLIVVPHRIITAVAGTQQQAYQSSFISDHTDISATNNVDITDQLVLGKSKPKSHLPEEKLQRYMKFGYYVDTQFSKRFLSTKGGATTTRKTFVGDEEEYVPCIVVRANAIAANTIVGDVQIRVYYKFQGKSLT